MKKYCILGLLLLLVLGQTHAQNDSLTYQVGIDTLSGKLLWSKHPVYDSRNHLAVVVTYSYGEDGTVVERVLQSFDKHEYKLRTEHYTADDELLFVEEYRWCRFKEGEQRRARMMRTIQYEEDGTATKSTYRYFYHRGERYIFFNGKRIHIPAYAGNQTLSTN